MFSTILKYKLPAIIFPCNFGHEVYLGNNISTKAIHFKMLKKSKYDKHSDKRFITVVKRSFIMLKVNHSILTTEDQRLF